MAELTACPWCGQADALEFERPMQTAASNYLVVRCNRCGIRGPSGENAMVRDERTRRRIKGIDAEASAAEAWNRRAPHPDAARLDLIERHRLDVMPTDDGFAIVADIADVGIGPTARAALDAAAGALEEGSTDG